MDISLFIALGFVLVLTLSYPIHHFVFLRSRVHRGFSELADSHGKFIAWSLLTFFICVVHVLMNQLFQRGFLALFDMGKPSSFQSFGELVLEPYIFAFLGGILFTHGFRQMVELRHMRDIPTSSIRGVAAGIAEVHGTVIAQETLTTPFSKSICVAYECELHEFKSLPDPHNGTVNRWECILNTKNHIPFYIQDTTGRILVDPDGAMLKLPERAYDFLNRDQHQVNNHTYWFGPHIGEKRYVERFLAPRDTLYVLGTVQPRTSGHKEHRVIGLGEEGSTFIISSGSEDEATHSKRSEMLSSLIWGILLIAAATLDVSNSISVYAIDSL